MPSKGSLFLADTQHSGCWHTSLSLHSQTSSPYFTHGWLTKQRSGRPLYTVHCRSFQAGTSIYVLRARSYENGRCDLVRFRIRPASCSTGKSAEIGRWKDKKQPLSSLLVMPNSAMRDTEHPFLCQKEYVFLRLPLFFQKVIVLCLFRLSTLKQLKNISKARTHQH